MTGAELVEVGGGEAMVLVPVIGGRDAGTGENDVALDTPNIELSKSSTVSPGAGTKDDFGGSCLSDDLGVADDSEEEYCCSCTGAVVWEERWETF